MSKKKILMVCEAFGGGVFTYVCQLCNDMVDHFDIFLAYSIRKQTPKNYKDFLDKRIHLIEVPNFGSAKKVFKTIKILRKIEKDVNPEIIHLHSSVAGGIGRMAFKGKNNNVIYTPHGYAHILMGGGFKSKIYYLIEKILGKKRCLTLTCSKSEDDVARTISKKTYYIETGLNIEELNKSLTGVGSKKFERFTVFTLGRACVQKQPELFNKIATECPDVDFYWIGGGELENKLTAPNIVVTGWKSRKEALELARGADVFVLCSLGEAIAMSLLENMYLKKLCLVSNKMGNKSVIENGRNGFVCDSVSDYVKAINESKMNFPCELVNNAYDDIMNKYNTKIMKEKFIKFYDELR